MYIMLDDIRKQIVTPADFLKVLLQIGCSYSDKIFNYIFSN